MKKNFKSVENFINDMTIAKFGIIIKDTKKVVKNINSTVIML